jgi:hypothetical protein
LRQGPLYRNTGGKEKLWTQSFSGFEEKRERGRIRNKIFREQAGIQNLLKQLESFNKVLAM